jgi:hypothetical protein
MSSSSAPPSDVATIRLVILIEVEFWLEHLKAEDVTQVEDQYILRQMGKFDCFSREDVLHEIEELKKTTGILIDIEEAKEFLRNKYSDMLDGADRK